MSILNSLGIKSDKSRLNEEFVYNLVFCCNQIQTRIDRVLTPFGLSTVKLNALLIIKHVGQDKGISQKDLSQRMIVTAGNITRLLDRLQKAKLVERIPGTKDRRVNSVQITQKASELLDSVWPRYIEELNKVVDVVSRKEVLGSVTALNKLRENLQSA